MLHLVATVQSTHTTAKTMSAGSLFLRLILALAVVLGIIYAVSRVARRRVGTGLIRRTNAPLAVLGRQQLGKGVQVAIVRAGRDTWLLGVTAHQVTRLGRFQEPDLDEDGLGDDLSLAGPPPPSELGWRNALRQIQERTVRRG